MAKSNIEYTTKLLQAVAKLKKKLEERPSYISGDDDILTPVGVIETACMVIDRINDDRLTEMCRK